MIEIECEAFSVVMNRKALTESRSPGRRRPRLFLGSLAPRSGPGSHDEADGAPHARPWSAPRPCPDQHRAEPPSSATTAARPQAHAQAEGPNDRCSATASQLPGGTPANTTASS